MTNSILLSIIMALAIATNSPQPKADVKEKNVIERPTKRDDVIRGPIVRVKKPNLDPLPGASVSLYTSTGTTPLATLSTSTQGTADFGSVPAGSYVIKVSATGYSDITKSATAVSGKDLIVHVTMQ